MLAVVAFASSMASAELLKNFKYDGKIEVNASQTTNGEDLNSKTKDTWSDVQTRVQINAGFDLNEDANAVVSLVKNNRDYGDGVGTAEDLNTVTTQLFFEQAYLNLKGVLGITDNIRLKTLPISVNLSARIQDALTRQAEREARRIDISVDGSVVTLNGHVHSWAERNAAEGVTWSAPGVSRVVNQLVIEA